MIQRPPRFQGSVPSNARRVQASSLRLQSTPNAPNEAQSATAHVPRVGRRLDSADKQLYEEKAILTVQQIKHTLAAMDAEDNSSTEDFYSDELPSTSHQAMALDARHEAHKQHHQRGLASPEQVMPLGIHECAAHISTTTAWPHSRRL